MLEHELNWGLSAARLILRKLDFRGLNPMIFRRQQQSFSGEKREEMRISECGTRHEKGAAGKKRRVWIAEFGMEDGE